MFPGAAQNGLTKPTKALQPPIKSTGKSAERGALQSSPGNATERNALKPPKHPGKPTERSAHELSKLPSTKPPEISTGRKALQPSHGKPTTGRTPKASNATCPTVGVRGGANEPAPARLPLMRGASFGLQCYNAAIPRYGATSSLVLLQAQKHMTP